MGVDYRDGRVFLGERDPARKVNFNLVLRGDYVEVWIDFQKVATLTKSEWTFALANPRSGDDRPLHRIDSAPRTREADLIA